MPRNPYYSGPPSDHFDGARFFNPGQPTTDRGLRDILRWQRGRQAVAWPRQVPIVPARPEPRLAGLRVTMVGHATLLIQVDGLNLLTDPVWSARASPFRFAGPKRVTAPGIAFDDLPPIDAVLLSHNHYDHLDIATLRRLHARHAPLMVMPLGNDAIVRAAVPGARLLTGDWHDRLRLGPAAEVTLTRANHWSARGLRDRRMALWAGFWLHSRSASLWFAGDTGYGDGTIFPAMRARFGSPDVALIPIGAYEPRWFMAAQHVDPAEAVRIFEAVGARRALGIHWGCFRLTDEAREAPVAALAEALAAADIAPDRFVAAVAGGVYGFAGGDGAG
ncbi:MBL fold metallo-hydrolase [Sphingomonas morindae]|uniref:MBL fold metallo-hydrolase n=1 Tax=Sphingomonas morindae TaxID=1541170 RepID=A0ABY4X3Q9_9SPHN|nr:MBL fold metallo-hydrolase [Sphingomonas morindae]USI71491.1 MBL fold metallo-hydrolase [Sphingomonas morindae]